MRLDWSRHCQAKISLVNLTLEHGCSMREIQNGVILGASTELKMAQVEIWCSTGTLTMFPRFLVCDDKDVLERSQLHYDALRFVPKVM